MQTQRLESETQITGPPQTLSLQPRLPTHRRVFTGEAFTQDGRKSRVLGIILTKSIKTKKRPAYGRGGEGRAQQ